VIKQIAVAEGITDRTVRMHLQRIKKKLYADDLINAVVIADKMGMIGRSSKAWRWQ
jgi:DNA-binding NarL/FixJ family response regulator